MALPLTTSGTTLVAAERAALVRLAYELLDAHDDTARLAHGQATTTDLDWHSHLAYLRDLQRVGRELLAELAHQYATT